jgi:hypothetical protein
MNIKCVSIPTSYTITISTDELSCRNKYIDVIGNDGRSMINGKIHLWLMCAVSWHGIKTSGTRGWASYIMNLSLLYICYKLPNGVFMWAVVAGVKSGVERATCDGASYCVQQHIEKLQYRNKSTRKALISGGGSLPNNLCKVKSIQLQVFRTKFALINLRLPSGRPSHPMYRIHIPCFLNRQSKTPALH